MNLIEMVKAAGVVGAGGAGFPTHVKLNTNVEYFIVNAAECEPLIETDKYLCRTFADRIIRTIPQIAEAIGASKKDVGRVFNAETLIVGFVAGIIGIVITLLLNQVVNVILFHFTGIAGLRAVRPVGAAVILVAISMFLTLIAGLIPSGFAAKKNPVEALRSE